mmetsp:Transcript_93298/g.260857  ORF Transcript_93298/g.260857 Transcript_93298/m.260857 type:complete len:465 (-) Transcript_93298:112-1506(-)
MTSFVGSGLLLLLLSASQMTTAFQGSRHCCARVGPPKSLLALNDMRRRDDDRYFPNGRDYRNRVIDAEVYEERGRFEEGPGRRGSRSAYGRPGDFGVQGRNSYGRMGDYSVLGRPDYLRNELSYEETNDVTRHLWIVVWATCWFYVFGGFSIVAHPPPEKSYFFKMEKETMQMYGALLAFLSVPIYGAMSRLSKSFSLQEAQVSVLVLALTAMPACAIVSIFNPWHNRGWTGLALVETTMFLGVFIAHHVRLAALREGPQPAERAFRFEQAEIASEALEEYRPPLYYQSTQVAAKLTRDLVSFHVAVSVISSSLILSKGTIGNLFPFNGELWPWVLVLIHMGHNCMITAMFPAAQLSRFRTYLLADAALYGVHIYAALSSPTVQQWLQNPEGQTTKAHAVLGDQILVLWFVADAAMQLIGPLARVFESIDFDEKFGLEVFGRGSPVGEFFDDEYDRRALPPGRR